MILLVDNYDSFTWNLVQALESLGGEVLVKYHDNLNKDFITELNPSHIVISPGPGRPDPAGSTNNIIKNWWKKTPILGICLGHQYIGSVFGADIVQSRQILHGKTSLIHHRKIGIFKNIPTPFHGARYHSLSLDAVPDGFTQTAWTSDGEIMGIAHKEKQLFGLQFHPESFLTPLGSLLLENFIRVS